LVWQKGALLPQICTGTSSSAIGTEGNRHLCPNKTSTPLVFYIPGCDTLKEAWPHPFFNAAHQRGMHVFSFGGGYATRIDYRQPVPPPLEAEQQAWVEHLLAAHRQ
jgi:hypothetical protein